MGVTPTTSNIEMTLGCWQDVPEELDINMKHVKIEICRALPNFITKSFRKSVNQLEES